MKRGMQATFQARDNFAPNAKSLLADARKTVCMPVKTTGSGRFAKAATTTPLTPEVWNE